MARPLRLHVPGKAYHVFARGDNRGLIFHETEDYEAFLSLLQRALDRFAVACVAFCLLDNHYHLLLVPHRHSVSRVMQYVNGAYAQWFNRKYGRVGHVFQGRFGSKLIDDAGYLLTAVRYIAMNPVEAGRVTTPDDWRWGSHRATVGLDPVPPFLALDRIWAAVDCQDAARGRSRYIAHMAGRKDAEDLHHAVFAGGERLARELSPLLLPFRPVSSYTYAERFAVRPSIDTVFLNVDSTSTLKRAAADAFNVHAYTLAEIGGFVGRDPSTVSKWIKKVSERVPRTPIRGPDSSGNPQTFEASG
jgi:REP element-mobilizing transposase RayT